MKLYQISISGAVEPLLFETWPDANDHLTDRFLCCPGFHGAAGKIEAVDLPSRLLQFLGDCLGSGPVWQLNCALTAESGVYFGND